MEAIKGEKRGVPINAISIKNIITASKCPAKLFWQYKGITFEREYSKPLISPNELGKQGEKEVQSLNPLSPQHEINQGLQDINYEQSIIKRPRGNSQKEIDKYLEEVYKDIKRRLLHASDYIDTLPELEHIITPIGFTLKEKYDLEFVIPNIEIYNPVYHYPGKPDFLGIRKDGSTIIVDSKNVSVMDNDYNIQMQTYLDSFNRRDLTPSSYEVLDGLTGVLCQEKQGSAYKDILKEKAKLEESIKVIESSYIKFALYKIFEQTWLRQDEIIERIDNYPHGKKINIMYTDLSNKCEDIKNNILQIEEPERKRLEEIITKEKPKFGVLFNTRNPEKSIEIRDSQIDLPQVVKSIWLTKKNCIIKKKQIIKNTESCSRCNYKTVCLKSKMDVIAVEDDKFPAIPTIIHKAYKNFENRSGKQVGYNDENIEINEKIIHDPKKFITSKIINEVDERGVRLIFNKARQTKKYYISKDYKKLDKSFQFWKI